MTEAAPTIRLRTERVGRQWLVTSEDVPGLYVAHDDLETAMGDVRPAIEALDRVRVRLALERQARIAASTIVT